MELLKVAKTPFFFMLSEQKKNVESIFHSQNAQMAPSL